MLALIKNMNIFLFLFLVFPEYIYTFIKVEPSPNVQGIYGKPVYFNCTMPSTWETIHLKIKDEHGFKFALFSGSDCDVPRNNVNEYTVSCHGNTITFGILRPKDNTTWECTFQDRNSETEESGSTTIEIQPDIPNVSLGQVTYVYTEGSDVIIPCTFTGAPISNVTWQREKDIVEWTRQPTGPLALRLKNVSRTAAGNYTCSATVTYKGVYTASESFALVVEYPPTLMPGREMVVINEGSALVNLSCTILEHGLPYYSTMYWQHWIGNRTVRNMTSDIGIPSFDPASSTFTLSLQSVSFNDTGNYVCKIRNGITDLEGNIEKTATVSLIVQSIPKLIQMKTYHYGEIGKPFHINFNCFGNPTITLQIKLMNDQTSPPFNVSLKSALLPINVYNASVYVNGYTADMDFGIIKEMFNTTYEFIAENALGTSNYTFVVEGQEFPSEPYHIYFKEYETSALLEWEATVPDLDKQYTVLVKNGFGDEKNFKCPGSNSKFYSYHLTDLSSTSHIIQLCSSNGVGQNCSSTFKVKMAHDPGTLEVSTNQTSKSGLSVGVVVLITITAVLGLLSCFLFRMYRRKRSLKLQRRQTALLRRDDNIMQRISYVPVSSGAHESESRSCSNTYLTPQCMSSALPESAQCTTNSLDGGEYARVDDIGIEKLREQRKQGENVDNGEYSEIAQQKNVKYVKKR